MIFGEEMIGQDLNRGFNQDFAFFVDDAIVFSDWRGAFLPIHSIFFQRVLKKVAESHDTLGIVCVVREHTPQLSSQSQKGLLDVYRCTGKQLTHVAMIFENIPFAAIGKSLMNAVALATHRRFKVRFFSDVDLGGAWIAQQRGSDAHHITTRISSCRKNWDRELLLGSPATCVLSKANSGGKSI